MFEGDGVEVNMHGVYKDEKGFRNGINLNMKGYIPKSVWFYQERIAQTTKIKSQDAKENSENYCGGAGILNYGPATLKLRVPPI